MIGTSAGGASWWAVSQSKQVPDFYTRARNQSQANVEIARNQLEHDVEQVRRQSLREGFWEASFGEEEINAWIQSKFPEQLSRSFVPGSPIPRLPSRTASCSSRPVTLSKTWDTIVSCRLSVEMTEEPNLLAIALSDLKAGALPLPLEPFVRKISKEAAIGDLDVRWDFTQNGPIALVKIPRRGSAFRHQAVGDRSRAFDCGPIATRWSWRARRDERVPAATAQCIGLSPIGRETFSEQRSRHFHFLQFSENDRWHWHLPVALNSLAR